MCGGVDNLGELCIIQVGSSGMNLELNHGQPNKETKMYKKLIAIAFAAFAVSLTAVSAEAANPCPVLKKNGKIVAKATSPYKTDVRFGGFYRTKHPTKFIVYNRRTKVCVLMTLPGL